MIDNDSTVTNAAPQTPTQPQLASNAPQTQPTQTTPSAQPSSNMVSNPAAQPANPQPQPARPATDPNSNHPLVQHASVLHSIAETLAGGPRYKSVIDATGKTTLQKIPLDGKGIGMAIALSAISGALAGLQEKGPNANAKAVGAGFNTVMQQHEKADEEARKQANEDFARQMAVTSTNFQLHQNAMNLGHQDYDQHKQYVTDHRSIYDTLTKIPGAIKAEDVPESDLSKYHVTKDTAIPVRVVPRLNADGSQAQDKFGMPLWDNSYAIVDPHAKISLPDDVVKTLSAYGIKGYTNSEGQPISIGDFPLKAHTVLDGMAKASAIKIAEANLNRQSKQVSSGKATPIDLKSAIKADPSLVDALEDYQKYAGFPIDQALDLMSKSKDVDASSVGRIANLVGQDVISASRNKRLADDEIAKKEADKAVRSIHSADDANSALADPESSSELRKQAQKFLDLDVSHKAAVSKNNGEARSSDDTVLTTDPTTGKTAVMSRSQAEEQNLPHIKVKDPEALRSVVVGMNDVQNKLNELYKSLPALDQNTNQRSIIASALAEAHNEFKLGAFGMEIPTGAINKLLDRDNYKFATAQTRAFVNAYLGAREAVTQLPRLQTFGKSNRMTQSQMDAAVKMLPGAELDKQGGVERMHSLQTMIDPIRSGMPTNFPGAALLPSFVEQEAQK